jgi:hypothetical protein
MLTCNNVRSHSYASAGEHTVTITGQLWGFRCTHAHADVHRSSLISVFCFLSFLHVLPPHSFNNAGDKSKIRAVSDPPQCPCLSCPCVPVLHTHMSTHMLLSSGHPVGLWLSLWRHWQQLLRLLQSSNHCHRRTGPDRHHQHGAHV